MPLSPDPYPSDPSNPRQRDYYDAARWLIHFRGVYSQSDHEVLINLMSLADRGDREAGYLCRWLRKPPPPPTVREKWWIGD